MADGEGDRGDSPIASKPNGVTHEQLSKFQELHRRRLQIKSKSKIRKNKKGATGKSQIKYWNTSDEVNVAEHSRFSNSDVGFGGNSSHVQQDETKTTLPFKKLQKLHWGRTRKLENLDGKLDLTSSVVSYTDVYLLGLTPRNHGKGRQTCKYNAYMHRWSAAAKCHGTKLDSVI